MSEGQSVPAAADVRDSLLGSAAEFGGCWNRRCGWICKGSVGCLSKQSYLTLYFNTIMRWMTLSSDLWPVFIGIWRKIIKIRTKSLKIVKLIKLSQILFSASWDKNVSSQCSSWCCTIVLAEQTYRNYTQLMWQKCGCEEEEGHRAQWESQTVGTHRAEGHVWKQHSWSEVDVLHLLPAALCFLSDGLTQSDSPAVW